MLWSLVDIHTPETNADSARGYDDDLVTLLPQLDSRLHNQGEDGEERLMALFVDN
jgi:hypothetical protein